MALISSRNIPLFALVVPTVLTRQAGALLQGVGWHPERSTSPPTRLQSGLNRLLLLVFAAAALLQAGQFLLPAVNAEQTAASFPVEAVAYLNESALQGDLFNSYNNGGYLIWAAPDYPVFIDGRADLHGDAGLRTWYAAVSAEPGWVQTLDKNHVGIVLIEPHWPLVNALRDAGWQLEYADERAVILTRP